MKFWQPTALCLALMGAFPLAANAQSIDELRKELKALKEQVNALDQKLKAAEAKPADKPQWGMTPEQAQELNRIIVKTEALEDAQEAAGFRGLKVSGYIEPVFIYNKNQHRAGFQFLNDQADGYAYDTSFMGAASIDFTKEMESGTRYKLTLTPQRGVGAAIGAGIVQEASVSIPLTDLKTRLIAGQVPDWSGYEYQQPTLNPFTTHNLLYDFTLPFAYTGVGLDVTIDKWWLRGMVANVNSTIRGAGETSPVLALRVDYSKGEYSGFGGAAMFGKGPNFNTGTSTGTALVEVDGYFTRGDWTLQGQVSYGKQTDAAITTDADGNFRDAQWAGISGLAGFAITPRLQALVRADYLRNSKNGGGLFTYNGYTDDNGDPISVDGRNGLGVDGNIACGVDPTLDGCSNGANRYALSFGLKYAFNTSTTFKVEYRYDAASQPVFLVVKDGSFKKSNQLLGTSLVVAF